MITSIYNRFRRITSSELYFPEIDGIRFLAILMVVLFHIHGYFIAKTTISFSDNPHGYTLLNTLLRNGDRGVELFFVLSGFILCLPFAHQYINNGKKVVLKKYYLRRLTRLEPPYLLAMTIIFVLQLVMHIHPSGELVPHWLASLIYAHDIIYHQVPMLTVVAWSLEIEIQFYLLAPLLFKILSLPVMSRRSILVASSVIIIYLQNAYPPSFLNIYSFLQYFLTGILLADLYVSNAAASLFNKNWMLIPALLSLITIIYLPIKNTALQPFVFYWVKLSFPIVIAILYYSILKNDLLKKIFSYKFIPIIGGMCYTIYLLHYTIISMAGRFTTGIHFTSLYLPNLLLQAILLIIPVLLLSGIFYYCIERPFMSRKWMDLLIKRDKKTEGTNKVN